MKIVFTLCASLFLPALLSAQTLIGSWQFNGNANDASGNNLNGTVYNATLTAGQAGLPNTAYQFNGTSSHIDVPYSPLLNLSTWTIQTMVRIDGFNSNTCQEERIVSRGTFQGSDYMAVAINDNTFDGSCATASPANNEFVGGAAGVPTGSGMWVGPHIYIQAHVWYCVAMTYDGSFLRTYQNGNIVDSIQWTSQYNFNTQPPLIFGYYPGGGASFPYWVNGAIDNISIWNGVIPLTASVSLPSHRDTICSGSSITLSPVGSGGYSWSPSTGLSSTSGASVTASPTTTTTYYVTSTSVACNTAIDSITIVVAPAQTPTVVSSNTSVCAGDTIKLTASNTDTSATYKWTGPNNFTANTPAITIPHSGLANGGTYHVVTKLPGCNANDSVNVLVDKIHATFTASPDTACQGVPVSFSDTTTNNTIRFRWSFGDGGTDTTITPSHIFSAGGKYQVVLADYDGICRDTAKMYVTVDSLSTVSYTTSDSLVCQGKAELFTGKYLTSGYTSNSWTLGDGSVVNNTRTAMHGYEAPGIYHTSLTVNYRVCPNVTYNKDVTVNAYPTLNLGADTSMCPNANPIQIGDLVNAGNSGAKWSWNTGDTSALIGVGQPGTYYATVTINGCATSDTVVINNDCYLAIPNSFTPNNDGTNDYFFPRQRLSSGVVTFKMDVYNRWGQVMFETLNINGRGWDGKFNSLDQPDGVYIYTIQVTFTDGESETYKGNVTLLR